ncbi:hypothetical protein GCM10027203_53310 [Nonomuraea fastidiosa]|jgi:hypothetical protein
MATESPDSILPQIIGTDGREKGEFARPSHRGRTTAATDLARALLFAAGPICDKRSKWPISNVT